MAHAAYDYGFYTGLNGGLAGLNPYKSGTVEHSEWLEGLRDGWAKRG